MILVESRRRYVIFGCVLLALANCSPTVRAEHPAAIELQPGIHLFVDDYLVDKMTHVWRSLNRPRKHPDNPLVRPDRPWEGFLVMQPGTVIFDGEEQLFKMWYNTIATHERPHVEDYLCYATSKDGFTWKKPELGLVEFRGSKANNILLKWCNWTHCVIKDDQDPDPARRYKLAYGQGHERDRCGIWVAFSPDGKRWTHFPENPVVPCWATGDTFQTIKDPETGQFILYHKSINRPIRKVSRMVSDDFVHWRDSHQILQPDGHDPPDTEFYGLTAFRYAGQYLGLLSVYHNYTQFIDFQLVSSRDGVDWERSVARRRFMVLTPDGNYKHDTFDAAMVFPSSNPFIKDGKVWIYYAGFTNLHNAPSRDHDGQIGLGTVRQDGFVSLDATSEGWVLTRPLRLNGSSLWVNTTSMTANRLNFDRDSGKDLYSRLYTNNPSARGYVRVEVQNSAGLALKGYEASNCKPVMGEEIYQQVLWKGDRDLSGLRPADIRLKFILGNAKLYSIELR